MNRSDGHIAIKNVLEYREVTQYNCLFERQNRSSAGV